MNVLNFVELIKEDKYQKQLTTMKRSELNKTKLKKICARNADGSYRKS